MPPRAVVFDLGGVLIDVFPERSLAHWREAAGSTEPLASLAADLGTSPVHHAFECGRIGAAAFYAELARLSSLELPAAEWERGWNAMLGPLRRDMAKLVERLARKTPLFLFSNTNPVHDPVWRPHCAPLLARFTEIFVSHRIGLRKPDPAAFAAVAAAIGLPPADLLFLDDLDANVDGARRAGFRAERVTRFEDALQSLARHGLSIGDPDDDEEN